MLGLLNSLVSVVVDTASIVLAPVTVVAEVAAKGVHEVKVIVDDLVDDIKSTIK